MKEGEKSLCTDFLSQSKKGVWRHVEIEACVFAYRSVQGQYVEDCSSFHFAFNNKR